MVSNENVAKKIVENSNHYLENDDRRTRVALFLDKFSQCEVYARSVLIPYLKSMHLDIKSEDIGLDLQNIKDALFESGIYYDYKKLITRIFGAESTKGISSCRWLRNKISHELMKRALSEVCERYEDLIRDMDLYIEIFDEQS